LTLELADAIPGLLPAISASSQLKARVAKLKPTTFSRQKRNHIEMVWDDLDNDGRDDIDVSSPNDINVDPLIMAVPDNVPTNSHAEDDEDIDYSEIEER
jgi:hypothetical protein